MILLVTGGRVATVDSNFVAQSLSLINQNEGPIKLLVHGDAKGIDRMCGEWAEKNGIHVAKVPALWYTNEQSAGPLRNEAMLLLKPDLCVAFPGRAGTADMKRRVLKAGIRLITAG